LASEIAMLIKSKVGTAIALALEIEFAHQALLPSKFLHL